MAAEAEYKAQIAQLLSENEALKGLVRETLANFSSAIESCQLAETRARTLFESIIPDSD